MRAVCWEGKEKIQVETVPDPVILNLAIDRFAERLELASSQGGAETLNYEEVDVLDALRHMTGGQGPDSCIDAVGLEAHGTTLDAWYDRAKTSMFLATDRPHALRQAISACRKGGTVSIPGVYGGWLDKFPLGAAFAKGLTLKMGQTHMHKYMPILLERIERGEIDPSFIITHRIGLEDAPAMYRTFRDKHDACIKVVMKPGAPATTLTISFLRRSGESFMAKSHVRRTAPKSPSPRKPPRTKARFATVEQPSAGLRSPMRLVAAMSTAEKAAAHTGCRLRVSRSIPTRPPNTIPTRRWRRRKARP